VQLTSEPESHPPCVRVSK